MRFLACRSPHFDRCTNPCSLYPPPAALAGVARGARAARVQPHQPQRKKKPAREGRSLFCERATKSSVSRGKNDQKQCYLVLFCMTIVNTIDITKEKPRYNKNGKSIIFSKKELKPSNTQSIVTAITLQRQNPTNSIPKNSRNKTNRPNRFLCFSFFICYPLQSYKMQSTTCEY